MDFPNMLRQNPVMAILRADTAERFGAVTDVLVDVGITAVEFTLTSAGVMEALEDYAKRKPEQLLLGAGTVLTAEDARRAVDAGAGFLVAPNVEQDVLDEAQRLQVPMVPGAFSPTEINTAAEGGAQAVKVFPAGPVGPGYLQAVAGPFPGVPLLPTGDIGIENARAYLDAGAVAVGLGGPLIGDAARPGGDPEALRTRARRLLDLVRDAG